VAAGNKISTFDLPVEVSRQVPAWLSLKQRDHFRSRPFLTTALFISGASTAYTALLTLANLEDSSLVYLPMVRRLWSRCSSPALWPRCQP
jgi:hypothetical protein